MHVLLIMVTLTPGVQYNCSEQRNSNNTFQFTTLPGPLGQTHLKVLSTWLPSGIVYILLYNVIVYWIMCPQVLYT